MRNSILSFPEFISGVSRLPADAALSPVRRLCTSQSENFFSILDFDMSDYTRNPYGKQADQWLIRETVRTESTFLRFAIRFSR